MPCFAAAFATASVVGPGTGSAASYQRLSWPGQKYGPLKISCRQSTCTPFFPASSMNVMCLSRAAFWTFAMGCDSSFTGLLHWIRPPITLRGIDRSPDGFGAPRLPAADDDLLLGVEVDGIAAVRLRVAEERLLRAAEGEERHGRGDADVDTEHGRVDAVAVLARRLAAGGEDARGVRLGVRVDDLDRLVERLRPHQAQHGAEDLLLRDRH